MTSFPGLIHVLECPIAKRQERSPGMFSASAGLPAPANTYIIVVIYGAIGAGPSPLAT